MNKHKSAQQQSSYLFQLEIMIEHDHHATALEQLIHKLNGCAFADYRITSGVMLGELIDRAKLQSTPIPIAIDSPAEPTPAAKPATQLELNGMEQIRLFMKSNTLIRLIVNKGLGIKLSIPCRVINMDETEYLITVYHVDEKQVYTFRLNEIEDFIA